MSDLPSWPGASVVYSRLGKINEVLCRQAYQAAAAKSKRKKVSWSVPECVQENIEAMNRGDEEACKAGVQRHLTIALS